MTLMYTRCYKRILAAIVAVMLLGLVYGDDLSEFQCTAGDVEILGPGNVINEDCSCTGTFTAQVQFTVRNNAASDRGCTTLHLTTNSAFPTQRDILLPGVIPGKTTQVVTVPITGYPCNAGLICFGEPTADGRRRCDPNTCATVSWTVPGQDTCPPDRQISSKCRHQRICIQSRGPVTLDCDPSPCNPTCGGTVDLKLCSSGFPDPVTFTLSPGGLSFGPTNDDCHTFTGIPITATTTFTGTVTDSTGCAKTATKTITVNPVAVTLDPYVGTGCKTGTLKATVTQGTGPFRYTFTKDGANLQIIDNSNKLSESLTYTVDDFDVCHTIGVTVAPVNAPACSASDEQKIRACASVHSDGSGTCPATFTP